MSRPSTASKETGAVTGGPATPARRAPRSRGCSTLPASTEASTAELDCLSPSLFGSAGRVTSPRSRRRSAAVSALSQSFISNELPRRHSHTACSPAAPIAAGGSAGGSSLSDQRRVSDSAVLGGRFAQPTLPELPEGSPFRGLATVKERLSLESDASFELPSPQSDAGLML